MAQVLTSDLFSTQQAALRKKFKTTSVRYYAGSNVLRHISNDNDLRRLQQEGDGARREEPFQFVYEIPFIRPDQAEDTMAHLLFSDDPSACEDMLRPLLQEIGLGDFDLVQILITYRFSNRARPRVQSTPFLRVGNLRELCEHLVSHIMTQSGALSSEDADVVVSSSVSLRWIKYSALRQAHRIAQENVDDIRLGDYRDAESAQELMQCFPK